MSPSPTLSTDPLPHTALDYARLRARGIELLERLCSGQWTDFNTHDPGITILEQLCYAITELAHRTAFPVPDILAGGPDPGLPPPDRILTGAPVTDTDIRRVALDEDGVRNAWVEVPPEPELELYYHAPSGELRFRPDAGEPDAAPVSLRGLRHVSLQGNDVVSPELAVRRVAERLHACRGVGEDFEVGVLGGYSVWMRAQIEIGPTDDPVEVLADVVERVDGYLAPAPVFAPAARALADGVPPDEVFDGPRLTHGFVTTLREPPKTVFVSDVLHAILDVPGVRAVPSLVLGSASTPERWALEVPPGAALSLSSEAAITLRREGVPVRAPLGEAFSRIDERRRDRARATSAEQSPSNLPMRPRELGAHTSIQYQMPAAYGVGDLGLPGSSTAQRKAQALQLEGYLLLFDQLLSNAFAQLASARELLTPNGEGVRTYFAAPVVDPRLRIAELLRFSPDAYSAWLDQAVDPAGSVARRQQFLGHLLARFAEHLGDDTLVERGAEERGADEGDLVSDRRSFLQSIARLGGGRGSGRDILQPHDTSALEERLRHKVGRRTAPTFLAVVEHILLRPMPEDAGQISAEGEPEVPMLTGVDFPDPWSQQATVVLRGQGAPQDDPYVMFVQQTIFAETPAHIDVRILWLDDDEDADWTRFSEAWEGFLALYSQYRRTNRSLAGPTPRLPSTPDAAPIVPLHLLVRAARDRLIDMLGIGDAGRDRAESPVAHGTYPLRDLPVPPRIVVTPGMDAKIPIAFSQPDVFYVLCDAARFGDNDSGVPIEIGGVPVRVDGTGGPIDIPTPPIVDDITYRILAVKRDGAERQATRRQAWLREEVRLEESVDPALVAQIDLPLLDARIDTAPLPQDARIGDYGVQAIVEVLSSQEGVLYEIVEHREPMGGFATHRVISERPVLGTSGTIELRTIPIHEDIDLRVRGSKSVGDPPQTREGVLDVVLPLRVRANASVPVALSAPVVGHGESATIRIEQTQRSVSYQVWSAPVRDRDFFFEGDPPAPTIGVATGGNGLRVLRPAGPGLWEDLARFSAPGAAVEGNDGALVLELGAAYGDRVFVVKASKLHSLGPSSSPGRQLPSEIQLERATALLVRPDPLRRVDVVVTLEGNATTGSLLLLNGQPGVLYAVTVDGAAPIPERAYFHQRHDVDPMLNKGIGERPRALDRGSLRISTDFVVARDHASGDPARVLPSPPRLDTPRLSTGAVLRLHAARAMTGLETDLVGAVAIEAVPPMSAVPPSVAAGSASKIVIDPSREGERYWIVGPNGEQGEVATGTGGRLELPTGPRQQSSAVVVAASSGSAGTAAFLERRIELFIEVTPP